MRWLTALLTLTSLAAPAHAQLDPLSQLGERRFETESGTSQSSSTGTSVIVHGPSDDDATPPERVLPTPQSMVAPPLEEPLDPKKYVCGRGDTFDLNFWGQQNFHLRVTVDTEGRAFIPKIGYVEVDGKTLQDAREIIKKQVKRYYPGLSFDLSLAIPRTFSVHVVGFVPHPGLFVANPVMRVGTVLANAGIASSTSDKAESHPASRRRISITRRDGTEVHADLVLYELSGDTKLNPFVMDGDVIHVPFPELVVTVTGAVKRPGRYELISSKDLDELFAVAGGFRETLTTTQPLRVIHRGAQEHYEQITLPFGPNGAVPNRGLRNEDEVIVPDVSELQRTVLLIGPVAGAAQADEVTSIRRLAYFGGATVRQLIEGAGGLGASADLNNAYIQRSNGEIEHLDLDRLLVRRDFSADRAVSIGDSIVVPQKRRAVLVAGAVMHPGALPYNPSFRGQEYIISAGGPSKNARPDSSYRVVSPDGRSRKLTDRLSIAPGDSIVIPERSFSRSEVVTLVMGGVGLVISSVSLSILLTTK